MTYSDPIPLVKYLPVPVARYSHRAEVLGTVPLSSLKDSEFITPANACDVLVDDLEALKAIDRYCRALYPIKAKAITGDEASTLQQGEDVVDMSHPAYVAYCQLGMLINVIEVVARSKHYSIEQTEQPVFTLLPHKKSYIKFDLPDNEYKKNGRICYKYDATFESNFLSRSYLSKTLDNIKESFYEDLGEEGLVTIERVKSHINRPYEKILLESIRVSKSIGSDRYAVAIYNPPAGAMPGLMAGDWQDEVQKALQVLMGSELCIETHIQQPNPLQLFVRAEKQQRDFLNSLAEKAQMQGKSASF